jgi:tetratricopeptide (TPR) repeat protein
MEGEMHRKKAQLLSIVAVLSSVIGCTTLQIDQNVQEGRNALLAGQPDIAVNYFSRAAESNPNYKTSYTLRESVWTYLGRAYYETGKYQEARAALDKALATDKNDFVARLYLGMTLVRSNERERGLAEMATALNETHQWLETLTSESAAGAYWDPNRQIRKTIEKSLAEKPTAIELIVTAQRVGKQLEEEISRSEQDRTRSLYNEGGK